MVIDGVPVVGNTCILENIIKDYKIKAVLISILTSDSTFYRNIYSIAKSCEIEEIKIISAINDISNFIQIGTKDLKDLDYCDLLKRQPIFIDTRTILPFLKNKKILVTGAAGSIGSEISKQLLFYNPEAIGILDINESDLANLEIELNSSNPGISTKMYLHDICDEKNINRIFNEFKPDIIFHAAAYKHIPILERFPEQAVKVNILGTYNLIKAAEKHGTKHFVFISTDKAVNPISIMGASKRVAELLINSMDRSKTKFITVRFGNVIGSRGSVLPLFIEQIKKGGPVTVTHPEMKRYFMTVNEAVSLIMQAVSTGDDKDMFILDMGEQINILELAKELITIQNMIPDKDILIKITGTREGEKLSEDLMTTFEEPEKTGNEKILKVKTRLNFKLNIDDLISEFNKLNGNSDKQFYYEIFKKYIPELLAGVNRYYENKLSA